MEKSKDIDEGEIVDQSLAVIETKAVNLTPKQMQSQVTRDKEIRTVITAYIKENLKAGLDYGTITIERNGKSVTSKPTLFKPGSEKFCSLFKIRPVFRKDVETVDMLGSRDGIVAYICELYDGKGRIVGEGRGVAVVDFAKGDFNVNKQVKLAEKRAQIDAILRTGGLSDFFTQDIEDMPMDERKSPQAAPKVVTSNDPATESQKSFLIKLLQETGMKAEDVGIDLDKITKSEISKEIESLLKTLKKSNGHSAQ
jgi:hypothetical protein